MELQQQCNKTRHYEHLLILLYFLLSQRKRAGTPYERRSVGNDESMKPTYHDVLPTLCVCTGTTANDENEPMSWWLMLVLG